MAAPNLSFSANGTIVSGVSGYNHITVTFSSDIPYTAFEARATKSGEDWGRGKGRLVAAFSQTPANTTRSFDVYDDDLIGGDGEYRISLFAQGQDGSWNDNHLYVPSGSSGLLTVDGKQFLCMKE